MQNSNIVTRRSLSVSKLLAADLAEQVDAQNRYDQGKRQALAWLKNGELELGGQYLSRDAAHER